MSATETRRKAGRPYDPAARKRAQRPKRYRGGYARSAKAGSVIVSLYREPLSAPRFYTVELDGYADIGTRARTLTAYVLDRAYGHRVVARYIEIDAAQTSKGWLTKVGRQAWVRDSAAAVCARLNAEHDAWLAEAVA